MQKRWFLRTVSPQGIFVFPKAEKRKALATVRSRGVKASLKTYISACKTVPCPPENSAFKKTKTLHAELSHGTFVGSPFLFIAAFLRRFL